MFWTGEDRLGIFGIGGCSREIACLAIDILGSIEKAKKKIFFIKKDDEDSDSCIWDIPVIREGDIKTNDTLFSLGIGNSLLRSQIASRLNKDICFANLKHPNAIISPFMRIGEGAVLCAGVVVTCDVSIGKHAQLNRSSNIGHDCRIGDFFSLAPGGVISGRCTLGDRIQFGANASIREELEIVSDTIIGMGAMIVKSITNKGIYIGNPAKILVKSI